MALMNNESMLSTRRIKAMNEHEIYDSSATMSDV